MPQSADEIVVTGSRVTRSGFDSPTPTKVLSAEAIDERGLATIGEYLNELPSFRNTTGQQTATSSTLGAAQNYADLRSLGNIRTLTLVDGRRHVPSSANGQVDLNLIPSILIERVEVVTGGASAAYGSDAISGVVNIILNKKLQGVRGDLSYGLTQYGDNRETRASLAFGTAFAEGRGHLVIGGDYIDNSGVLSLFDRDWGREQPGLLSYVGTRAATAPSRLYDRGVAFINITYGGLITGVNADTNASNGADVLRGIQFGPGGTPTAFNYGNFASYGSGSTLASGFTGGNPQLFPQDRFTLSIPMNRRVVYAHVDYDVTDRFSLFLDASYGRSGANNRSPAVRDTVTTGANAAVIRRDNAFLPASIVDIMTANNITSFTLGREWDDFGSVTTHNVNATERLVGGFKADLGGSWSVDGYVAIGRNAFSSRVDNLRIEQNFLAALDSINVNGVAVCRNAATAPTGCVALNPFGVGSPKQPAIDYVTGSIFYEVETRQEVASLTVHGEPLSLSAGPVSVAFGIESRRDRVEATSDDISQRNGFNYSNPKPFFGSVTIKEAFGEVVIPILKDVPFARLFEFNGAIRYTDYSTSGGVTTWKAGATYEPIDGIRFRATRSRDIRAPTSSEQFTTTSTLTQLRNPFTGATGQIRTLVLPSPTLRPETSDTTTVGVVLKPGFLPGLSMSADFYDINIEGAIANFAAQTVLDNCAAELSASATPFFCNFVTKTGVGNNTAITAVSTQLLNIASLRTRGVDLEAAYRFNLGTGSIRLRAYASYIKDLIFDDGTGTRAIFNGAGVIQTLGGKINRAGSVGGFTAQQQSGATNAPHWSANGSMTYTLGRLHTTVHGRYVGSGAFDNALVGPGDRFYDPASPISIADNRVPGRFYVNLSANYDLVDQGGRKVTIYGVINNLTNNDPPFPSIAIAGFYDRLGRSFKAGARFAF